MPGLHITLNHTCVLTVITNAWNSQMELMEIMSTFYLGIKPELSDSVDGYGLYNNHY